MITSHALVYYRKNYLVGVARPGALTFDGTNLTLSANDLSQVWTAPLSAVRVKKGMGILTVSINGDKTAILTAIGSRTSPSPSSELKGLLESGQAVTDAPSADLTARASHSHTPRLDVYAKGQKSLREYFAQLGVLD